MTSRPLLLSSALILVLLPCVACSDDGGGGQEESSETSGDGDGDPSTGDGDGDPSGDGDGDPSTGDGDGDPTGDGDGDPVGDGDGDPTGDGDCAMPEDAAIEFSVNALGNGEELDWDLLCSFDGVESAGDNAWELTMSECMSQNEAPAPLQVVLSVASSSVWQPSIPAGAVRLRYIEELPFFGGRYFALRNENQEVLWLGGLRGPSLEPLLDMNFDFAPLDVEFVELGCTPEDTNCGPLERRGLRFGFDGDESVVADGASGFVGQLESYSLVVEQATQFLEYECDGGTARNIAALFTYIPEG